MSLTILNIKDGYGLEQKLKVTKDDINESLSTHHIIDNDLTIATVSDPVTITSSFMSPILVTGSIVVGSIPNITGSVVVSSIPNITASVVNTVNQQQVHGTLITETVSSSFSWSTQASGTFKLCDVDTDRKELFIYNSGPGILYLKISSTNQNESTKFGFTINNTSSIPTIFNFVVYPSGTYITSEASRTLHHAGYFVSSSAVGTVVATSIS